MDQTVLNDARFSSSLLERLIREKVPHSIGGLLVGSVVSRPFHLVEDLDVVAVVEGGVGRKSIIGSLGEYAVECTCYDPALPEVLKNSSPHRFLLLREVRRICSGHVIFGDGVPQRLQSALAVVDFPTSPLREVLNAIPVWDGAKFGAAQAAELLSAVEALLFCAGCLFNPHGPTKPKWYLTDAMLFYPMSVKKAVKNVLAIVPSEERQLKRIRHLADNICGSGCTPIVKTLARDAECFRSVNQPESAILIFLMLIMRVRGSMEHAEGLCGEMRRLLEGAHSDLEAAKNTLGWAAAWMSIYEAQKELSAYLIGRETFSGLVPGP